MAYYPDVNPKYDVILFSICCNCKKIRDDQGYWNMLETYIPKHSQAEFSHSICPECANKLYPGLMKDDLFNDEKKSSQEHA